MSRILDQGSDLIIADSVIEALEAEGFTAEEIIPGLILAVLLVAQKTFDPDQALNEASVLIDDGLEGRE